MRTKFVMKRVALEWLIWGLLVVVGGTGLDDETFFGTLDVRWYPAITNRMDMVEYLRDNETLMTTAPVYFMKRSDDAVMVEAFVGSEPNSFYTLSQCLLDLFTRTAHQIQFSFASIRELSRVVEVLMLKDSPRIWVHLDLVPFPETTREEIVMLEELSQVLRWSKMWLSIGTKPSHGPSTDLYTPENAREMKRITEEHRAMALKTVFVLDGYVAQKQHNFTRLTMKLVLLDRVYFLFRIAPEKEDKVVVADLNNTMWALGGRFHVFLDASDRLRDITLNRAAFLSYGTTHSDQEVTPFDPCHMCQHLLLKGHRLPTYRGQGARKSPRFIWFTVVAVLIGLV